MAPRKGRKKPKRKSKKVSSNQNITEEAIKKVETGNDGPNETETKDRETTGMPQLRIPEHSRLQPLIVTFLKQRRRLSHGSYRKMKEALDTLRQIVLLDEPYPQFLCLYGDAMLTGCLDKHLISDRDVQLGLDSLRRAAGMHHVPAIRLLLAAYDGEYDCVSENKAEYYKCLQLSAELGDTSHALELAEQFIRGSDVLQSDSSLWKHWVHQAANCGNVEARLLLQAIQWVDDPSSTFDEGYPLLHRVWRRRPIRCNLNQYLINLAAEVDAAMGIRGLNLVYMYTHRYGTWPEDPEHTDLFGFLIHYGRLHIGHADEGMTKYYNIPAGVSALEEAHELGGSQAASVLVDHYHFRDKNVGKWRIWLHRAAERGSSRDAFFLAELHPNPKLAHKWMKKASRLGNEDAKADLIACSGPDCIAKDPTRQEFKMCKGCRAHFYCSAKCQKKHWKSGHREDSRDADVCDPDDYQTSAQNDSKEAHLLLYQCHGPGCQAQDPTGFTFQSCPDCKSSIYCSKNCQREHWKSGHRGECSHESDN